MINTICIVNIKNKIELRRRALNTIYMYYWEDQDFWLQYKTIRRKRYIVGMVICYEL